MWCGALHAHPHVSVLVVSVVGRFKAWSNAQPTRARSSSVHGVSMPGNGEHKDRVDGCSGCVIDVFSGIWYPLWGVMWFLRQE